MPRRPPDPLAVIPSADVLRRQVTETQALADRFRILLDVAEKIERTARPAASPAAAVREGGAR